jgi:hypothetical protein
LTIILGAAGTGVPASAAPLPEIHALHDHDRDEWLPGDIECPRDWELEPVGEGGLVCVDGDEALGPFTEAMRSECRRAGHGRICRQAHWPLDLVDELWGDGPCPWGAAIDRITGYCVEGQDIFGPFPRRMVRECLRRHGGPACHGARWNYQLAHDIMHDLGLLR